MSKETSTVEYLSNIQVIDTSAKNDTKYMIYVHDPFALDKMSELINMGRIQYRMTYLQKKEMEAASKHCAYAFKDDYPWGTVEIDGEKKVVCKCINQECSHFNVCRKGISAFSENELIDNKVATKKYSEDVEYVALGENFKEKIKGDKPENVGNSNEDIIDCLVELEFDIYEDKKEDIRERKTSSEICIQVSNTVIYTSMTDSEKVNITQKIQNGEYDGLEIVDLSDKKENRFKVAISHCENELEIICKYMLLISDIKRGMFNPPEDVEDDTLKENGSEKELEFSFDGEGFDKFIETEQESVIFADADKRIVVNAGPGTGKTYTLIEKLIYMVNELEVDPEEILVLCFSRAAVDVIEKRLHDAFIDDRIGLNSYSIDIRTFDSFATHLLSYVAENEREMLSSDFSLENLDYDERINVATKVIRRNKELIEQCSHLVIDEIQDLVSVRAKFVKQIIESLPEESGYTLLGDACQSIYDYQIQNGEIDSARFYSWIFDSQKDSEFWSFGINYRQISRLERLGKLYRTAILTGDGDKRKDASNSIYENVEEICSFDLRTAEAEEVLELAGNKRLGILTRTNGQALKISTWFRNAGIPHKVQKRLSDNSLNIWIADIFRDYSNDTIDKETFEELYSENNDMKIDAEEVWSAIEKLQYEAKNRYYVRDILCRILNNAKTKEFYTAVGNEQITISNIHRSKGHEFEQVILLDETLLMEKKEEKDLQEHKVSYVAVTRAKEKVYRTNIGRQHIRTDKKGDSRAFAIGANIRGKKPRFSHIEIGRAYDIDPISFADDKETQKMFDSPQNIIGKRVILVKNKEESDSNGYYCYDILLEDNMLAGKIGRTSRRFYNDLTRILKEIYGLYNCDPYKYLYPERFSDVYVDDVISVISSVNILAIAGKKYNDIMVWKGITIVGFAQVERDTY